MKHIKLFAALTLAIFFAASCTKDSCTTKTTYMKYEPIYKTLDEIRQPVTVEAARALKYPGKIYLYHNYLLINEKFEGIHVIDNNDPSNPVNVGFIKIEGNVDMAVKGNILYADSYIDLLTIDISDVNNPQLLDRDEEVFPSYGQDENGRICVAFEGREVTEDLACGDSPIAGWGNPWVMEDQAFTTMNGTNGMGGTVTPPSSAARGSDAAVGIGGSMARFTISGDYLYTVDNSSLHVFNIAVLTNPQETGVQHIGWSNIETIFPYEDNLFIGSNAGMYIYSISNPEMPSELSFFQHAQACDPVYVDGDRAYVTLRGGTPCQNFTNQLDVIDITDLTQPLLVASHDMTQPHGLSLKDETLYICDGVDGLKVFDASNDFEIGDRLLSRDATITTFDVIASPYRDVLLVIGKDGFYQYDNSDPANLQKLSEIPVQQ
jgi:hypothetical protein